MGKLGSMKPAVFRAFLKGEGWEYARTKGDHEIWHRTGAKRPVVFQKTGDLPTFVLLNNLRTMGLQRDDLVKWLAK
jgi:predicted RNA binding protein YcfA (HicA-like mRNA interferase family)